MSTYTLELDNASAGTTGTSGGLLTTADSFQVTVFTGAVDIFETDSTAGDNVIDTLSQSTFGNAVGGARTYTFGTGINIDIVATVDGTTCGVSV